MEGKYNKLASHEYLPKVNRLEENEFEAGNKRSSFSETILFPRSKRSSEAGSEVGVSESDSVGLEGLYFWMVKHDSGGDTVDGAQLSRISSSPRESAMFLRGDTQDGPHNEIIFPAIKQIEKGLKKNHNLNSKLSMSLNPKVAL